MTDGRAILIVEDDRLWQDIMREPLEDDGYDVTVVDEYQEGRQALEERTFDLVILDLKLAESAPVFDGERLLAHISQCYPGTPCIVVSGHGDIRVVRDAFKEYHVVDYIAKDQFDILTFIDLAKVALSSSVNPAALRRTLEKKFDLEEIQDLCFDLDIDFDDLPGEGKKARELVAYCRRHDRLKKLATRIAELRPGPL
jgi:DNA-binding NtrC family response regulator